MRVERDLQREKITSVDLGAYISVAPEAIIEQTILRMRSERIGAVLVSNEDGRLVGIFTERDVLKKVAGDPGSLNQPVSAVMTPDPETVSTDDVVGDALRLMKRGDYRNVPVLEADGTIAGNFSQQALIQFLTDRFPREIYNLPPNPELIPQTREGA